MNLEVTAVTDAGGTTNRPDARDWICLGLVGGGFIASWGYVFLHPSDTAFGICVGGVGTFGAIFHALTIHDDKQPDRKDS